MHNFINILNAAELFTGEWLDSCCEFHLNWKKQKEHSRQRTIKYKGPEAGGARGHGFLMAVLFAGRGGALRTDSVGLRRDDRPRGLLGPVQEFAAYPRLGRAPRGVVTSFTPAAWGE